MSRYRNHVYRLVIKTISGDKFGCREYFDYYGTEQEREEFKKKIFDKFKTEGFIEFRNTEYKSDRCDSFDVCINTKCIESISLIYETSI